MKLKPILASGLAAGILAGLLAMPVSAITFSDIKDPQISQAAELLHQLGVISGNGNGQFLPQANFTRAQFCKMALEVMGRGGEAALQSNRVIFQDVTGSHWALGYINAAAAVPASGTEGAATGTALMQGKGNSRFGPDDNITYGEAVTTLMRVLGYSDTDVSSGGTWYTGYLAQAKHIKLTDGLDLAGTDALTRGQAALLFENLLYTIPKSGEEIYLTAVLGGSVTDTALLLDQNLVTPAGVKTVKTSAGTYRTDLTDLGSDQQGRMVQLVLDKDKKVLALLPDTDFTTTPVRILTAEGRFVTTEGDKQILVSGETPVWQPGATSSIPYKDIYAKQMPYGTNSVFCYDDAGVITSIYLLGNTSTVTTMIATTTGGNPFSAITGSGKFAIYKNGFSASLSDLALYDVGVYDGEAGVLNVYDRKLTGMYENATPSPVSPTEITVMGATFQVMDSALAGLQKFDLGDPMTLLLDDTNRVVGVLSPSQHTAAPIGVATIVASPDPEKETRTIYTATVTLTTGVVLKGQVASNTQAAAAISSKLVSAVSTEVGKMTLTVLEGQTAAGNWNVANGTVGSLRLSPTAAIYERVGSSALYAVDKKSVTVKSVPAGKIAYYSLTSQGTIDLLVLENVTGDHFQYGIMNYVQGTGSGFGYQNSTVSVTDGKGELKLVTGRDFTSQSKSYMGIMASLTKADSDFRLEDYVTLTGVKNISRSAITDEGVTIDGVLYALDPNLDQRCYNATAKTWFDSLDSARAYTNRLTVYYDRTAKEGGKIRMIVAE